MFVLSVVACVFLFVVHYVCVSVFHYFVCVVFVRKFLRYFCRYVCLCGDVVSYVSLSLCISFFLYVYSYVCRSVFL